MIFFFFVIQPAQTLRAPLLGSGLNRRAPLRLGLLIFGKKGHQGLIAAVAAGLINRKVAAASPETLSRLFLAQFPREKSNGGSSPASRGKPGIGTGEQRRGPHERHPDPERNHAAVRDGG